MQYRFIGFIGLISALVAVSISCTASNWERNFSANQKLPNHQTIEPSPRQNRPSLLTPEGAMARYINSLSRGDLEEIQTVIYPPTINFSLPEAIPIEKYQIVKKTTLNATDVATLELRPIPQVGDVRFDVWSKITGQCDRMHSYFLRQIDGRWKIYTWFAWSAET